MRYKNLCIVFRLYLPLQINIDQSPFFDLEFAINRIDKKRQLTTAIGINIRRPLHLASRQLDAHVGENMPGLGQIDVVRLFQILSLVVLQIIIFAGGAEMVRIQTKYPSTAGSFHFKLVAILVGDGKP